MTRSSLAAQAYSPGAIRGWNVSPIQLGQRYTLSNSEGIWRAYVVERLDELVKLEEGWDGYRGLPVSFGNAHFAASMLESICRPLTPHPQIVPGAAGDLQIEWHTDKGDLELWIQEPYKVIALFATPANPEGIEAEFSNDFTQVVSWVREVTERTIAVSAAA